MNNICTKRRLLAWVLIGCIELTGCTNPAKRFADRARQLDLHSEIVFSDNFMHRVYMNASAYSGNHMETLHIYLDGDGSPWQNSHWPSDDPTPRSTLILELIWQDNAPALLLGRPCYYGLAHTPDCEKKFWTSHRYGHTVIASMVQALQGWLTSRSYSKLNLIGYSGGGTLATLMAHRLPDVDTLVTIAANLDVSAWSGYLGYTPLTDSLNPADYSLPPHIAQIHLAGLEDSIVPHWLIKAHADEQSNAIYVAYPGFTHQCCWQNIWQSILVLLHR